MSSCAGVNGGSTASCVESSLLSSSSSGGGIGAATGCCDRLCEAQEFHGKMAGTLEDVDSVGSVCPSVMCGLPGGLENWLIFSLLKADFARRVRLCCVFGETANEALLVTDDDEVWALGSNASGCLGIGDKH